MNKMNDENKKFRDLFNESLKDIDIEKIYVDKSQNNGTDEYNDFEETLISLDSLIDVEYSAEFRRPGVRDKTYKELKHINSHKKPYATIDLHQYDSTLSGLNALNQFFKEQNGRHQFLKIIHGKGLHNKDSKSPMRAMVRRYLINTEKVLAYVPAEKNDGYDGATYVLIKD